MTTEADYTISLFERTIWDELSDIAENIRCERPFCKSKHQEKAKYSVLQGNLDCCERGKNRNGKVRLLCQLCWGLTLTITCWCGRSYRRNEIWSIQSTLF